MQDALAHDREIIPLHDGQKHHALISAKITDIYHEERLGYQQWFLGFTVDAQGEVVVSLDRVTAGRKERRMIDGLMEDFNIATYRIDTSRTVGSIPHVLTNQDPQIGHPPKPLPEDIMKEIRRTQQRADGAPWQSSQHPEADAPAA